MCAASHSCCTVRSVDDKKVHVDEKTLILMGRTRPPALGHPSDVHSVRFLLHFSQLDDMVARHTLSLCYFLTVRTAVLLSAG
eukprot:3854788-Pyramimonas_sp.AAC.1